MPPSRRRLLQFGTVALAGSVAGCSTGLLEADESDSADSEATATTTPEPSRPTSEQSTEPSVTPTDDPTTHALGVDRSLPEGSVEFPDGPKSRPERPDDLTAESVREYVKTFEYRWVYNDLHRDDTIDIQAESGVDSVTKYGEGFRVVAWCSAWTNYESDGATVHADYFTQYATYFVGPDSTVRYEGKSGTRDRTAKTEET